MIRTKHDNIGKLARALHNPSELMDKDCLALREQLRLRAIHHLVSGAWKGDPLAIRALDAAGLVPLKV